MPLSHDFQSNPLLAALAALVDEEHEGTQHDDKDRGCYAPIRRTHHTIDDKAGGPTSNPLHHPPHHANLPVGDHDHHRKNANPSSLSSSSSPSPIYSSTTVVDNGFFSSSSRTRRVYNTSNYLRSAPYGRKNGANTTTPPVPTTNTATKHACPSPVLEPTKSPIITTSSSPLPPALFPCCGFPSSSFPLGPHTSGFGTFPSSTTSTSCFPPSQLDSFQVESTPSFRASFQVDAAAPTERAAPTDGTAAAALNSSFGELQISMAMWKF